MRPAIVRGVRMYLQLPSADADGITSGELAKAAGVTRRSAQRWLQALEAAGLVERDTTTSATNAKALWWRSEGLTASGCATETAASESAA